MRPIAVFRFSPTEGPAHFAEWLDRESLPWELIAIDAGTPVPSDARHYAGIGMMGGPMSVTDALAWIGPLSELLRGAVAHEVPVIGHCLGGQLLAQALGARVRRTAVPEIGWIDVESSDATAQDAWFGGRKRFTSFQWHYAYVIGGRHIGFQCHIEMTRDLVEAWCASGADEIAAPGTPPRQSADEIGRDLDGRLAALQTIADGVYARWAEGLVS